MDGAATRNEAGQVIAKDEEAAAKIGSKFPPGGPPEQLVTPEGVTTNVPKQAANEGVTAKAQAGLNLTTPMA